jgi:Cu+-exporting ATPase
LYPHPTFNADLSYRLDNIVKVVREGSTRRAPIERVADVITGYFVPVITLLAILTWVVWLILAYTGTLPPSYLDIEIGGWGLSFSPSFC